MKRMYDMFHSATCALLLKSSSHVLGLTCRETLATVQDRLRCVRDTIFQVVGKQKREEGTSISDEVTPYINYNATLMDDVEGRQLFLKFWLRRLATLMSLVGRRKDAMLVFSCSRSDLEIVAQSKHRSPDTIQSSSQPKTRSWAQELVQMKLLNIKGRPALIQDYSGVSGVTRLARRTYASSTSPSKPGPLTEAETAESCREIDPATAGFFVQQTNYRVKDPRRSLCFYTQVLGMTLLQKMDSSALQCSLYFLGYERAGEVPADLFQHTRWTFSRRATLELMHIWGSECQAGGYHSGNTAPLGYGHIGIHVPDLDCACARFEQLGVDFFKKPQEGTTRGIAFIKDPDGYLIEIISAEEVARFVVDSVKNE